MILFKINSLKTIIDVLNLVTFVEKFSRSGVREGGLMETNQLDSDGN